MICIAEMTPEMDFAIWQEPLQFVHYLEDAA